MPNGWDQSWECANCAMPAPLYAHTAGLTSHPRHWVAEARADATRAHAKSAHGGSRSAGPGAGALVQPLQLAEA